MLHCFPLLSQQNQVYSCWYHPAPVALLSYLYFRVHADTCNLFCCICPPWVLSLLSLALCLFLRADWKVQQLMGSHLPDTSGYQWGDPGRHERCPAGSPSQPRERNVQTGCQTPLWVLKRNQRERKETEQKAPAFFWGLQCARHSGGHFHSCYLLWFNLIVTTNLASRKQTQVFISPVLISLGIVRNLISLKE